MNGARKEAILQALWPGGARTGPGVWAVLDCARDPTIYLALLESRLEFRCLYSGKLPRALELNAPHLVELLPTNRLVHRWIDEGWGQSWGVFLKIDDASNLRHHLRTFLKVRAEDGRRLLFRYYDPRVLRVYLPTCRGDEWQQVRGPAAAWLAEGDEGDTLLEFSGAGDRPQSRRIVLPALSDALAP